jgi:hypothetical protein
MVSYINPGHTRVDRPVIQGGTSLPVSQTFIDLLRLPAPTLHKIAKNLDVPLANGATQWQAAEILDREVSRAVLEEQAGGYLYAGSTSMSWYRLIPEQEDPQEDAARYYPLYGDEIDRQVAIDALKDNSDTDPFDEAQRPTNVTAKPELVCARSLDEDNLLLTFVVARRIGHVIHNFETHRVMQDDFFNVVFRLRHGVLEVRSSATRAKTLLKNWIRPYAHSMGLEPVEVAMTERDYRQLHDRLDAYLDDYKGKDASGTKVFDTAQFSKAEDVADLLDEQEFEDVTKDLEPLQTNLVFNHGDDSISFYVSIQSNSIFVRTAVAEETLQHIYGAVEQVKEGTTGVR